MGRERIGICPTNGDWKKNAQVWKNKLQHTSLKNASPIDSVQWMRSLDIQMWPTKLVHILSIFIVHLILVNLIFIFALMSYHYIFIVITIMNVVRKPCEIIIILKTFENISNTFVVYKKETKKNCANNFKFLFSITFSPSQNKQLMFLNDAKILGKIHNN